MRRLIILLVPYFDLALGILANFRPFGGMPNRFNNHSPDSREPNSRADAYDQSRSKNPVHQSHLVHCHPLFNLTRGCAVPAWDNMVIMGVNGYL